LDMPRWWIQRKSWVARKRFSPKPSQKTAKPSRSKSRRLAVMAD